MNKIITALLILSSVTLFLSCNHQEVYFKYQQVGASGWHHDSLLVFNYSIEDAAEHYDMYVHVRHKGDYPYQNMWLFLNNTPAEGESLSSDTIEFYMADDFGKWKGNGVGSMKEIEVLYKKGVIFEESGEYCLELKHGMRDPLLKGVFNVGVRIEKSQSEKKR